MYMKITKGEFSSVGKFETPIASSVYEIHEMIFLIDLREVTSVSRCRHDL
jgi:hypothetical protein